MPRADLRPPDQLFSLSGSVAMLAWLGLALSPARARWAGWARTFAGRVVPLALALLYVALFAAHGMGDGGFGSLEAVRRLFDVPGLLVAGWVHYLAFALFVGGRGWRSGVSSCGSVGVFAGWGGVGFGRRRRAVPGPIERFQLLRAFRCDR